MNEQRVVGGVRAGTPVLSPGHVWLAGAGPGDPGLLTRDAFAVVADLRQDVDGSKGWNLDPNSLQRVGPLRKLLAATRSEELPTRLELLASVHFLVRIHPEHAKDTAQLRTVLQRYGKNFTEEQIRQAVEELAHHGLLPQTHPK